MSLYMIIERFLDADPVPAYRRFREHGRLAPEGLTYISSWVAEDFSVCYQVMETSDRALLEEWMGKWSDLVEFEVHPVMPSEQAAKIVPA